MDDKAKNRRFLKTYGISLSDRDDRIEKQGGVCAICDRPSVTRTLDCDHDHAYSRRKIRTHRGTGYWRAEAAYRGLVYSATWEKKSDAIKSVREQLKTASVRGFLCARHNKGLQYFSDNPVYLRAAAGYLERFQNPVVVQPPSFNQES